MADWDTLGEDEGPPAADQHDTSIDPVWGDVWNPEPNTWAPSMEPFPGYGEDASTVEYQDHGDVFTTTPMPEQWGRPDPGGGSTPDARANLLTDVRTPPGAVGPTFQIVQHEVHTYETGAEVARVRQVVVTSSLTPGNLLEENEYRKRALLRLLPATPTSTGIQRTAGTFAGSPQFIATVPAGQTWVPTNITFHYTCSAAVANRQVQVVVRDPAGAILYQFVDPTALTASQDAQVTLAPGNTLAHTSAGGTSFIISGNLPAGLVLAPGATITVNAINQDAADTTNNGIIMFTLQSTTIASTAAVFIAPRATGAGTAQPQTWFKLVPGDGPLELKTQEGIDVILETAGQATVQVYEEITRDGIAAITGIV